MPFAPVPGMTATVSHASGPLELARLDESEVHRLVRTYGRSVSTALFDPQMQMFALPWLEGAIGYRLSWGCAVAMGDPVCPESHRDALVEAFRGWCRAQGKDTIHAVVSDGFAAWLRERGAATVEFGYENVLDPRHDPLPGHAQQRLRGKVHQAERAGVEVRERDRAHGRDDATDRAMLETVAAWRGARHGPQIHLGDVRLFAAAPHRRWFCAWQGKELVGLLLTTRLEAMGGYVFNQLMQRPDAPPGTTELLGVRTLQILGREGCGYATFGAMAAPSLGRIEHLSPLSSRITRSVFDVAARLFHLDDREMYRHKYPVVAKPALHLAFDPPRIGAAHVLALMRVFNASLFA